MASRSLRKKQISQVSNVEYLENFPRAFKFAEKFVKPLSKNRKALFITLIVLSLIKSGIWVFPATNASLIIAMDPFRNPFTDPSSHYLMTTWLGSYVAYVLGIKTFSGIITYFLFCGLLGIIFLWLSIKKHLEKSLQSRSILFMALIPGIPTVFYWVGMDTFTFLLFALYLYFSANPALTLIVGMLMGMQHFEVGIVSAISLAVYELLSVPLLKNQKKKFAVVTFIIGILLGKFLLSLIFASHGISILTDRTQLGLETVKTNYQLIFSNAFPIFWSYLGVYWIFLVLLLRKFDRQLFALMAALVLPLVIVFFVKDQTRIMHLSSFLLLTQALVLNPVQLKKLTSRQIQFLILAWLVIPWMWFWNKLHLSLIGYDLQYLISRLFGAGSVPMDGTITMWPFS